MFFLKLLKFLRTGSNVQPYIFFLFFKKNDLDWENKEITMRIIKIKNKNKK